jgi:Anti-sigma-K factor rskA
VPHLDPDRLVSLALGEQPPSASETGHLTDCRVCRADLAANREIVLIGRETEHVRDLPEPPEGLWSRIAAEAFPPVAVKSRKPRRWRVALAAAALIGVTGAVGVHQAVHRNAERVVAEADLRPSSAAPKDAHGTATIVDTGHGLQLRVALSGMPATTGYYTVWLYDGRTVMVPIGSPGPAPLNVPAAAGDLDEFRIVDVSAQRLGQQEHGTSMVQGVLRR